MDTMPKTFTNRFVSPNTILFSSEIHLSSLFIIHMHTHNSHPLLICLALSASSII